MPAALPPLPSLPDLPMDRLNNFATPVSWGITDPQRFQELMEELKTLFTPGYYMGDNLITWGRNLSAFEDPAFVQALSSNIQNPSDEAIAWRRYLLVCSACHAMQLDGDFVECGVYLGTGIKTVIDYFGKQRFGKPFWGYDTFDYHPAANHNFAEQRAGLFEKVQQRFADYPQVQLIKGFLPDSFAQGCPDKVAYLHIDLNNAEGEIATLEHLWDRVVPGGMVVLDDYEWAGVYRAQKRAEDQWFQARGYRVFPLPTGQGFVIKR
ncbi:TylF/MycF/NovP-related O-methyltransferase [Alicycliphilus denitrificans]|uniref:TylF/MycF/NovP-related O-methyltransferase n=1 Tax=Alicycliphilus denitrificans TaxID=179636 RepID=UPI00384F6B85